MYTIKRVLYNDYPEYPEDYMQTVGHDTNNVQWMVSPYDEVLDENNGWTASSIQKRPPIDNNNVTNKQYILCKLQGTKITSKTISPTTRFVG